MAMEKTKEYSNGEVTVVWEAKKCIHSGICVKGLPKVFRPQMRPWVSINEGSTEDIINQVTQCPSGALNYYMNGPANDKTASIEAKVELLKDGPLLVHGIIKVIGSDGSAEVKDKTTAFCRCGASNNKPYCDGTHRKVEFKG